jgi:hypothetical protein
MSSDCRSATAPGGSDTATRTITVGLAFMHSFLVNPAGIDTASSLNELYDAPRTA